MENSIDKSKYTFGIRTIILSTQNVVYGSLQRFYMLSRLFTAALWSPAGKGLKSWLLFVLFNCVFVIFPCGILGQVWYLIVSISDLCRLLYFEINASASASATWPRQYCFYISIEPYLTPSTSKTRGHDSSFHQIRTSSTIYQQSFFPRTVVLWNQLPQTA